MKHRNFFIVAAAIMLVIIGLAFKNFGSEKATDRTLISDSVIIFRTTMHHIKTARGYVRVPFTADSAKYHYANVAIDFNNDGKFAAYDSANGRQEEWVVKNMYAIVIATEGNGYGISIPDLAIDERHNFKAMIVLTADSLESWKGDIPKASAAKVFSVASVQADDVTGIADFNPETSTGSAPLAAAGEDNESLVPPLTTTQLQSFKPNQTARIARESAGIMESGAGGGGAANAGGNAGAAPAAPPVSPDFSVMHRGVPDINQKTNECAPTATANSMIWLASEYGFQEKMPPSASATIEEFKLDMRWAPNGVNTQQNFLPGKAEFTTDHHIPIVSHQVGEAFDPDSVKKIAEELAKGQDVELDLEFGKTDANGQNYVRKGGHMVTAVGAWSAGGKSFIGIHDPETHEDGRLDVYFVSGAHVVQYRYDGGNRTYIRFIFAESPTEEWLQHLKQINYKPPDMESSAYFEARNASNTAFVDMLAIGGNFFPARQFFVGTGPDCNAAHWHATNSKAIGIDIGGYDRKVYSPEDVANRETKIVEWVDPEGCGAGKIPDVARVSLPVSQKEVEMLGAAAMQ